MSALRKLTQAEPSGSQGPGHGGGVAGGGAALPLGRHPKRGDG